MATLSIVSRGAQGRWGRRTSTSPLLSTKLPLFFLGSLVTFCCLFSFRGASSPSSSSWSGLLFFRLGMANRPRSMGGGRGGITGVCVLGASFELPPLFLLASRSFRLGHFFGSICSSSFSDSKSTWVIINCSGWTEDMLTDSVSESDMSTGFSDGPTSSTKQNWSISFSKDSWEDATSSSAATSASRETYCKGIMNGVGICWTGSLMWGRSSSQEI